MKRIILAFLIVIFLIDGRKLLAAEGGGYYLSPPNVDITVGTSQPENSFFLEVGNKSTAEVTFDLTVMDFRSLDETGGVAFLTVNDDKNERKYSLASWISLEKDSVTVAAGGKQKIKVTILNKDSLTPGGHYGAVLATVKAGITGTADSVGVNQSLATLIYALKNGGEKPDLELQSWEFNKNFFFFPKTVKLRFKNGGNIHVVPRGIVNVINSRGEIVAQGIINGDSGKILPESFRVVEMPVNRIKSWNWPGIYNLEVSYRYDGKNEFSVVKTKVVYVGFEAAVIVVVAAGIMTTAVVMVSRRKKTEV